MVLLWHLEKTLKGNLYCVGTFNVPKLQYLVNLSGF